MIKLENVCKYYIGEDYNITALDNINLKIDDGEFVSIVGKSGSGKSTLISLMGGIDKADKGKVIVDEYETSVMTPYKIDKMRKDKISFVFQHFALIEEFSVYENIELPLDAFSLSSKEKKNRIMQAMTSLGIEKYKSKSPRVLSGGEKQRVAIARALVKKSKYLLADEPTGALDSENTKIIMNILKKLNSEGMTVIIVTHDNDVANSADRIIELQDGAIISDKIVKDS